MLRRKLLARVGLLVLFFVVGAVVAIVLLQRVVGDVDQVNQDTALLSDGLADLSSAITAIEAARLSDAEPDDPRIAEAADAIELTMGRLADHPITQPPDGPASPVFYRLQQLMPAFLANGRGEADAHALEVSVALRGAVRDLSARTSEYVASERSALGRGFRLLVLGLTLAAIVMVNASVIVLLHTVSIILRPVDQLVGASRELAREHFDHRVEIDQNDEFGELAHAYNHLAEQLAANEERKMETLRQVAVALNHDLNNTLAAIELELRLVDLQTGGNPRLTERFERMHQSLARVARAVRSLAEVRRIVLTEYMPGQMMLDLERSVTEEEPAPRQSGVPSS